MADEDQVLWGSSQRTLPRSPAKTRVGTGAVVPHMPRQGGWMGPSGTEIGTGWGALTTAAYQPRSTLWAGQSPLWQFSVEPAPAPHTRGPQLRADGFSSFLEPWGSREPGKMCPTPLAGCVGCGTDGRQRGSPAVLCCGQCFLFLPQPCPAATQHHAGFPWVGPQLPPCCDHGPGFVAPKQPL